MSSDLAIRDFVNELGERPAKLVLDYIVECWDSLMGTPPTGASVRLAQWALARRSEASDEAEYFAENCKVLPGYPKWLKTLLEWPEMPSMYSATNALDEMSPGRVCYYCFHPRNSPECNFAAKHPPYVEMFKDF